jgi:hypothetical protein
MYYGYIVVTVEDHRTVMTSADNGNVEPTGNKTTFKIGDNEDPETNQILDKFVDAVRDVRDVTEKGDLQERWKTATQKMDATKMRKALDILEKQ